MNRKTNPLIQAINSATKTSRQQGHDLIGKAKVLEDKRMKLRVHYSDAFKDLDLTVHSLYVRASHYKPTIEVNLNSLDGFKDPVLVAILEFLTAKTERMTTRDWPDYLNRDFSFELDDAMVNISAYVRSDSPTCRKVQIGVKVEEVPQYQLVCD